MLVIQQYLRDRGLSQSKAARLADVNDTSMSRIVRGIEPPYPKRGQRIADALGWEGDWHKLFEEVEV
ncbi:MAG: helix-turn-helix transcriptional regulator [Atopobiaceae bacterium]|nr:helix-turn-helix transcriptional regulator [Atopobiaceae bacterium]